MLAVIPRVVGGEDRHDPLLQLPPAAHEVSCHRLPRAFRLVLHPLVSHAAECVPLVGPAALVVCRVCRERKIDES